MPKRINKPVIILLIIISLFCAGIVAFIGGKCLFLGSSSPIITIAGVIFILIAFKSIINIITILRKPK